MERVRPSHCDSHLALWSRSLAVASGVVTTNYDITAEQAMRHRAMSRPRSPGFHYGGINRPQVAHASARPFARGMPEDIDIVGLIPLFKLHGSLNWALRSAAADLDPTIERFVELYGDLRPAFRSGGDSAIVPPILEKNVPTWLAPIWEQAESCLRDAESWIVVGYSLPANDVALVDLFRRAAGAHLRSVEVWAGPTTQARGRRWSDEVGSSHMIESHPAVILFRAGPSPLTRLIRASGARSRLTHSDRPWGQSSPEGIEVSLVPWQTRNLACLVLSPR